MDEQKTFSGLPPSFATNIFDGCEEVGNELEDDPQTESLQWFWFFSVIALFFGGVAISYYIIHHPI